MGSRAGALAQLNSHFDVGMPVGLPCRPVPNVFRNCDAVQLPPVRRNVGTGALLHSHSVCVLQNKTIRSSLHESIDCCGEGEHYTCTVKARSVGVWRQISDMASFWIRPEYVVDYRPTLDAPVDAAGEVVEEIMLYCC